MNKKEHHRFIDEAGDTTFFGKYNKPLVGTEGVSKTFILGMLKVKEPLEEFRQKVLTLQNNISNNPLYQVPSLLSAKKKHGGYFLHAKNDIGEIRKEVFDFILNSNVSFEAVVSTKDYIRFERKYSRMENYIYADTLSFLLKNKLFSNQKLVLNIAERGSSTKNQNLDLALKKAKQRIQSNPKNKGKELTTEVKFNIQSPHTEPILNIADYFCWVVQRVFERGELRYYNYIKDKISTVIDIHDSNNYENYKNYYDKKNPLTNKNKKDPPQSYT